MGELCCHRDERRQRERERCSSRNEICPPPCHSHDDGVDVGGVGGDDEDEDALSKPRALAHAVEEDPGPPHLYYLLLHTRG